MPNLIEQANECFSKGDFEGKEHILSTKKKTKERRPLTSRKKTHQELRKSLQYHTHVHCWNTITLENGTFHCSNIHSLYLSHTRKNDVRTPRKKKTRKKTSINSNTKTGAIKCFDELIEKKMLVDPSLGYINKGVALRQLKRYDESLACFEEVRGVR